MFTLTIIILSFAFPLFRYAKHRFKAALNGLNDEWIRALVPKQSVAANRGAHYVLGKQQASIFSSKISRN